MVDENKASADAQNADSTTRTSRTASDTRVASDTRTAADSKMVADKAVADEKARTAHQGSVEGATSIAEAVKRVADAAVAEIQKKGGDTGPSDFHVTGSPGGRIVLEGPVGTFGPSGTVKIGNTQINTREWSSQRIVGDLPAGMTSGVVEVWIDAKTVRRGYLKV